MWIRFLGILTIATIAVGLPILEAGDAKKGRPFLAGTFQRNKAIVVDAEGKIEWEFEAPACFDVWALSNKNYLIASRAKGIFEVTPDKKVVFLYKPAGETYTCQPLAEGKILVGDNQNGRLIEVDREGKIEREVKIQTGAKPHGMIRTARKLPSGNYLVSQREDNVVREYDPSGKTVWEYQYAAPMTAIRLGSGTTLINGHSGNVVEVDREGKTVWEFGAKDRAANKIKASAPGYGVQRLSNGNTVIAINGTVFETTPDKKVLWVRNDDAVKGTICVQLLDVPGDPAKGEIQR